VLLKVGCKEGRRRHGQAKHTAHLFFSTLVFLISFLFSFFPSFFFLELQFTCITIQTEGLCFFYDIWFSFSFDFFFYMFSAVAFYFSRSFLSPFSLSFIFIFSFVLLRACVRAASNACISWLCHLFILFLFLHSPTLSIALHLAFSSMSLFNV